MATQIVMDHTGDRRFKFCAGHPPLQDFVRSASSTILSGNTIRLKRVVGVFYDVGFHRHSWRNLTHPIFSISSAATRPGASGSITRRKQTSKNSTRLTIPSCGTVLFPKAI